MGANAKTIQVTLKTVADIKDVTSNVAQLQKALSGLSLSKGLEGQFTKLFTNVERNAEKASTVLAAGFKSKGDVTAYEKATNLIVEDMKKISQLMGQIDTSKLNFQIDTSKSKALTEDIARLKQEIDAIRTQNLTELQKLVNNKPSGAKAWDDFFNAFQRGDEGIEVAEKALKRLQAQVDNAQAAKKDFSEGSQWDKYQRGVTVCANALQILKGETGEAAVKQAELNQKTQELNTLQQQANNSGAAWLQGLLTNLAKVNGETETYIRNAQKSAASTQQLGSELDQFKSRIAYFFGMSNAVSLFQRAIRSAYETVKDLDAVMTETAVVTDFSVGDMWSQLPEYTQRANELGVSIHSAYEAATIYYQQGLKTNEVMAVSNETLKMARIAGLDAATATDRMTNALRGFNMEINETNAQRVNDVYSELAAITASDTDEISTAMTKVASLANNANMEFETTSAFLAQMIETTRESAETAGTALKTVIARFSEVKELYSEGELLGTDSEGEAIDVNKVSTALRTAGINLNEYLTGMKGLDDIFIELAQKWNSLDIVQQRYIATMAAGSRQQSRFIAMMSDYDRTMELVDAANNSSGASNEQYQKTLESLETKLTKLKNAWDEFTMGLANSTIVKGVIDLLTWLIDKLNVLTSAFGDTGGAIAKLLLAFVSLKIGKALFSKFIDNLLSQFLTAGEQSGASFIDGFKEKINGSNLKSFFKKEISNLSSAMNSALKNNTDLSLASFFNTNSFTAQELIPVMDDIEQQFKTKINFGQLTGQELGIANQAINDFKNAVTNGTGMAGDAIGSMNQLLATTNQRLEITPSMAEKSSKQLSESFMSAAAAAGAASMALGLIANGLEKLGASEEVVNSVRKLSTAFGILAGILMILPALCQAVRISIETIPIIGWIAAIITALITLGSIIADFIETDSEKTERLADAAQEAAEAAEAASEAFSHLQDSLDGLDERSNEIEELAHGTEEWKEATSELNKEILDLVDQYPELAAFVTSKGGVLSIDLESEDVQNVLTKYENAARAADSAALNLKIAANNAAMDEKYDKLGNAFNQGAQAGQWVDNEGLSTWVGNENVTKQMAKALAGDQEAIEYFGNKDVTKIGDNIVDFAQKMADAEGVQFDATTENIKALQNFGQALNTTSKEISTYYQGIINNSLASLEGYTEQQIEILSNYYSTDQIEAKITKIEDDLEGKKYSDYTESDKEDYEKYFKSVYGDNFKKIGAYGKVILREGDDIDADSAHRMYAASKATEKTTEDLEKLNNTLGKLSKYGDNKDKNEALSKVFAQSEGAALTQGDLTTIGFNGKVTGALKNELSQMYKYLISQDEEAAAVLGTEKDFIKKYTDNLTYAYNAFDTATKELESVDLSLSEDNFTGLSSGALKSLSDNLLSIFNVSGEEGFNEIKDAFVELTKDMTSEETEKFANALNSIDWSSADSIDTLGEVVEDLGLDTTDINDDLEVFEKKLIKCANAIQNIDLDKLTEQVQSLPSIASNINKGTQERSFSEGDYKNLIESGTLEASDFAYNIETGKYDYLGDSTDRIVSAIQEQTDKLLGADQLEKHIASGEAFNAVSKNQLVDKTDADSLYEFLTAYFNEVRENATIDKNVAEIYHDNNNTEKLLELYNIILNDAENLSQNKTQLDTVRTQGQVAQAQLNDTAYNAHQINGTNGDIYSSALTAQAAAAGVADKWIQGFKQQIEAPGATEALKTTFANQLAGLTDIYNEATTWEVDQELLGSMGDQFIKTYGIAADMAYRLALSNINLNQGVSDLVDSYSDWSSVLKAAKTDTAVKETAEYAQTIQNLKKNIKQMFSIQGDLSNSLIESADAAGLLEAIANGDMEAIDKLRAMAAEDIRLHWNLDDDSNEKLAGLEEKLINFASQWDGFTVDAKFNNSQALEAMNSLLKSGQITTEQMQDYFNSLGYTPEVEYEYVEQNVRHVGSIPHLVPNGDGFDVKFEPYDVVVQEKVAVPSIKSLQYNGPSAPKINTSTKSNAASNQSKSSGDSGSSEKPSYWENPYDELYNLQEKINESLRTREALERRYQKLLDKTTSSLSEIRKAYYDQIKQLRAEADLQQAMAKGRKRQLNNIANETYTDSEGVQRSFASMGVTKYASYNASTGVITIDWSGLEAISRDANREEEGKAAEAYISRLEELVEGYEEIRDELWDIEDKIEELRDEVVESYLDFEDRVMEAVVNEYQEQIDAFQAMSDEISNTTSKVLDSIREEIDLTRQIRDNTKTEEEISDMENRLAYLRRDTSGANDLEIMKLEKDLEDARQNYTDTLIDQALDQMQKDADLAAEQRAQQQETLQNQLDIMKENGSLWDQVYTLIRNAEGSDGSFSKNSELVKLLKSNEGFNNLSNIGKAKWWEEASAAYKAAMVGKNEAEDKYGVDADNNGVIAKTGTQKAMNNVSNKSASVTPASTSSTKSARTNKEKYGVALAVLNGGYGWGSGATRKKNLEAKGFNYNEIQGIINKLVAEGKVNSGAWVGAYYGIRNLSPYAMSKFKSGGLADFTGPAWLDGTKSHPELVLDATDSQNFITLKNILAQLLNGQGIETIGSGGGDNYFDIDISAELGSDYDVDQLADRIKKQIYDNGTYRNVNTMNYLR